MSEKPNRHKEIQPDETTGAHSFKNKVSEARLERMFQAARLYYEERKVPAKQCPACGTRVPNVSDATRSHCPRCGREWTPDQKVRLTQDDVAELMWTPIYQPSRSEVQRLLSEAE